ncbi:hypothetical protein C8R44DRAFT_813114 [Mycena epipterygia]|nr:hypothetical protein C8R44DRAFT_813114 [Mycena epipterygia]
MAKMRAAEEARDARDMDKLLASYDYPRAAEIHHHHFQHGHPRHASVASSLSAPSLYSQVTGMPHRVPEPKEPVRPSKREVLATSRFSGSTLDAYYLTPTPAPVPSGSKSKNPFWK